MSIAERIAQLGLDLPVPPRPVANYVPFKRVNLSGAKSLLDAFDKEPLVNGMLYLSGMLPMQNGELFAKGKVGQEVSIEDALTCAQICTLNGLGWASIATEGKLDDILEVVQVRVVVACGPDFFDHPRVANGCSDLLADIFGEDGRHARVAVGAPSLPLNAPVEIDFVFSLR